MASTVNSEASDVKAALTEEEPAGVWEGVRACKSVQKAPGLRSLSLSDHFTRLPFPACFRSVGSPPPPPASPAPPLAHPSASSAILPLIFRVVPSFMSMFIISNFPCANRETTHTNQSHTCPALFCW